MTTRTAHGAVGLYAVEDPTEIDREGAMAAVASLLTSLGRDLQDEHLADTPRRVVDGLLELLTPAEFSFTTFPNDEGYDDLVLVRDIRFTSLCRHHLLPFRGVAHVGYLPGTRVIGLSKLARVVDHHARDLQVQERMTVQIADELERRLDARGVGVVVRAEHLCMSVRGIRAEEAATVTSAFRGELATDPALRARFESRIC